jgi:hypothetical protein
LNWLVFWLRHVVTQNPAADVICRQELQLEWHVVLDAHYFKSLTYRYDNFYDLGFRRYTYCPESLIRQILLRIVPKESFRVTWEYKSPVFLSGHRMLNGLA